MANKQLTANVKLNTSSAEKSIDRLAKKIQSINKLTNSVANKGGVDKNIEKAVLQQEKLKQATLKTQLAQERLATQQEKLKQATLRTQLAQERLVANQQKSAQASQLNRMEWQKAHPILSRLANGWQHIDSKIRQAISGSSRLTSAYNSATTKLGTIKSRVQEWWSKQNQVNNSIKQSHGLLGSVGSKLKSIAAAYLGIMGTKAAIGVSDTITSTQNRLNNLSGNNKELTQNQMDKMYASANKVRMAYTDMLSNASKSMTLAGDAFQNNMDNAIRFQEIMAETYTLGGASAAEMSSSMYQMIQALGSGTLAGDELRSVREGAPLAYKAIEDYVQGVMAQSEATKEFAKKSLKDIASEGLVTSEMVVAAVMNAGDKIDQQFNNTSMTFAQAWDRIKNSAIKAFEPVSNALNKMLNKAAENGAFEKIENAFFGISKVLQITMELISRAISWIVDNWNWLKYVVLGVLLVIMFFVVKTALVTVVNALIMAWAWLQSYWSLLLIIATLMVLMYFVELFKQGVINACELITIAIMVVAVAFLIAGIIMGSVPMLIIALVLVLLAVVFYFFEQVCYGAGWLAAWIVNIVFGIINFIISCIYLLLTFIWNVITLIVNSISAVAMFIGTIIQWIVAFIVNLVMGCANSIVAISHNCVAAICNVGMGLFNSLSAIAQNIGIAFQNAWIWAKNTFWEFIADVLRGVSKLEPVINGIAKLMGKGGINLSGAISNAESKKSSYKSFVSVGKAWNSGMDSVAYKDVGNAWSNGWNTMKFANMGDMVSKGWNAMDRASYGDAWKSGMSTLDYVDANAWGKTAGNWGAGIKDSINDWASKFRTDDVLKDSASDKTSMLDKIGKKLGLDFSGLGSGFPNANDPAFNTSKGYNAPSADDLISGALGDIADDTGSMADSMDLTEDDLKYLRKLAESEWKKEYNTNNIKIEMTNNNQVNGDSDLDGIVTKLTSKLNDELNMLANGVYA